MSAVTRKLNICRGTLLPEATIDPRVLWRPAGMHSAPFLGLLAFTLVLYLRPNDLLPIGDFPVAKVVGAFALAAFAAEQLSAGRLTVVTSEVKYFLALVGLMALSVPTAINPAEAMTILTDGIFKVFAVFVLIINVAASYWRVRRLLALTVVCGTVIAVGTIWQGENLMVGGYRVKGVVGGMFGNPNDLALALNMFIPLAMGLALTSRGLSRLVYLGSAAAMTVAMFLTYSRGGFLGFLAMAGFMVFRVMSRPAQLAIGGLSAAVLMFAPMGFATRMLSMFDHSLDPVGSATARTELLWRSLEVAAFNPKVWLVGVGLGNFHIVSINEKVNHNGYLQVFTEVGLPALVLYLLFIYSALKGAHWAIRVAQGNPRLRSVGILAASIEASLIAYIVSSFFASVAHLWYLYYAAGSGIALRIAVERARRRPEG